MHLGILPKLSNKLCSVELRAKDTCSRENIERFYAPVDFDGVRAPKEQEFMSLDVICHIRAQIKSPVTVL